MKLRLTLFALFVRLASCNQYPTRLIRTRTYCILYNDQPLCPGSALEITDQFIKITAGFPANSRSVPEASPKWEQTFYIDPDTRKEVTQAPDDDVWVEDDQCLWTKGRTFPIIPHPSSLVYHIIGPASKFIGCPDIHYVGPPLPNPWNTVGYGGDTPDYSDPNHLLKEGPGLLAPLGPDFSNDRFRNTDEFDPDDTLPIPGGGTRTPPKYDNTAPPVKYPPTPNPKKSEEKSEGDPTNADVFAASDGASQDPLTVATLPGSDTLWNSGDMISSSAGSLDPIPSLDDPSSAIATGPDLNLFGSNVEMAGTTNTDSLSADFTDGTDLYATNSGSGDANMFAANAGNGDVSLFADSGVSRRVRRSPRDFRF